MHTAMGSGNSVGSTEVQSVDLATIRAWSRRNTDWLLLKTHLTSEQYLVFNDLKWQLKKAHDHDRRRWNSKTPSRSMELDAAAATSIRKLLRLEVMASERRKTTTQENIDQVEEQKAAEKAQRQAELAQIEANYQLKVQEEQAALAQAEENYQLMVQERETKRQKVRDEKEESGVGFSVEQLEFNRGIPGNATQLEDHKDDYYYGPLCSNETHPEDLEHHAGEIAYTWYVWLTNELICPVDGCLPPVMTCISVTDAHHAELMEDMRHTSEQTFCHTTEGIPCCNKYTAKVNGYMDTIEAHLGQTHAHWTLCKLLMEKLIKLSNGKITWAVNPGAEKGGWHQAQVTYFIHRAAELNGGAL